MQNLERQISAMKWQLKNGKVKNEFAIKNKITNLEAQLAAKNKAKYWNDWVSK